MIPVARATISSIRWLPAAFPPAVVLEIVQYEGDSSFFLLSISADGSCSSDTWHQSIDDAKHQAEYQYGVQKDEWIAIG
jgi:hypothetical protein